MVTQAILILNVTYRVEKNSLNRKLNFSSMSRQKVAMETQLHKIFEGFQLFARYVKR